jgi:hypothetical protein
MVCFVFLLSQPGDDAEMSLKTLAKKSAAVRNSGFRKPVDGHFTATRRNNPRG